jgi:ankyrin repeat protein
MNDEELVFAAGRGDLQAVRELLAAGADPDSDDGDWNALTASSMRGHIRVVQELLAAGADPNAAVRGNTALLSAAGEGRLPVIQELIAWGADPTLADNGGRTPLDYPEVQQAWQERLAAERGLNEYSTRHNLPSGFSDQVFRILYPR